MGPKIWSKAGKFVANLYITDPDKKFVDNTQLYPRRPVNYPWENVDLQQLYGEDVIKGIVDTSQQAINATNPQGYSTMPLSPGAIGGSRTIAQSTTDNTDYMRVIINASNEAEARILEAAEIARKNKEGEDFLEEEL
jgi:hypothetical protein